MSTHLVESYRDEQGRPRQRVLANMHRMPDIVSTLAKLAVQRDRLRKERDQLTPEIEQAEQFYRAIMTNTLAGHRYRADQRKEIDRLMRLRKRFLKRAKEIEKTLSIIQKDGAVIRKHCPAANAEIQEAAKKYRQELERTEAIVALNELSRRKSREDLRRLSMSPTMSSIDPDMLDTLLKAGR